MYNFAARNRQTHFPMETVTLTFNPASPFAASMEAFLKTVPRGVKVSKSVKPVRKRKTEKECILANITKGMQQALDMAKKPHKTYTAEELIDSIFDD